MKKLLLLACITIVLVSCNKVPENEYTISGTIHGLENGKMIILEKQSELGLTSVDTVKVEEGKFEFKGTSTAPSFHLLQVESVNGKVPIILEKGEINVVIYKDSLFASKVSGTYNNEQLAEFNTEGKKVQNKMNTFQNENNAKMKTAQENNDTVVIDELRQQYLEFQKELQTQAETYMESHPNSFITVMLIQGALAQPNANMKQIEKNFNSLSSDLKNTKEGKEIAEMLKTLTSVEIGSIAPDFSAPNPEGKMVSLKESLGKITIIDFWASWCGPCRRENPNVVALYNEFHDKGLNIIGVSLDKEEDADKWKKAIADDQLTWTQVSNLKFWQDPIAAKYNVKGIPQMFILDATGTIIAKDLRGEELRAKIKELLGA